MLKRKHHSISIIFIIFLTLIFVMLAVLIISFGSKIYNNTVTLMNTNYEQQTSQSYFTSMVRHHDNANMITIKNIDSHNVLLLGSTYDDVKYITYIYEYDGFLYEYFTRSDLDFSLENGTKIIELSNLSFIINGNLLTISYDDSLNFNHEIHICLHSSENI